MALTLISELKLKTEKGQDVTFYLPFLNDNRQLQFNFCSAFQGADYIVDEDKKAVEIRRRDKSTFIYFSKRDEQKFDQVMRVKQEILIDLRRLNQNFSTGKESLYAIESKDERYPFLITSPSIIDNGRFSIKYNKAIMYYINDKAKKKGKNIEIHGFEEMLHVLGQALKHTDVNKYKSGMLGNEKYYSLSIDEMVEIL